MEARISPTDVYYNQKSFWNQLSRSLLNKICTSMLALCLRPKSAVHRLNCPGFPYLFCFQCYFVFLWDFSGSTQVFGPKTDAFSCLYFTHYQHFSCVFVSLLAKSSTVFNQLVLNIAYLIMVSRTVGFSKNSSWWRFCWGDWSIAVKLEAVKSKQMAEKYYDSKQNDTVSNFFHLE